MKRLDHSMTNQKTKRDSEKFESLMKNVLKFD